MAKKFGQGVELEINGFLTMHITNMLGEPVEEDIEQGILDNLQQGEYLIGIQSLTIMDINDLETPIYKFTLESGEFCEYNFDEL